MAGRVPPRFSFLLSVARAFLAWEDLWPRIWPAMAALFLFVAAALMDLLPALPPVAHGAVLALWLLVVLFLLVRGLRSREAVSEAAARRRLERDSGLDHRPLEAFDDTLVQGVGDKFSERLWARHQERMAEASRKLRLNPPSPNLAARDRFSVRAVIILAVAVGLTAAGTQAPDRMARAMNPFHGLDGSAAVSVSLWITPPAYTRAAPVFLQTGQADQALADKAAVEGQAVVPASVPDLLKTAQGSNVLVQVSGADIDTDDRVELLLGDQLLELPSVGAADGSASFRIETHLDTEGVYDLAVRVEGRDAGRWPLDVAADREPTVEFMLPPGRVGQAGTKTEFIATDDYGLDAVSLVIRHPKGIRVPGGDDHLRARLPVRPRGGTEVQGIGVSDFSAHPWAGLEVTATLEAVDGAGNVGISDTLTFVLPERIFNHPVARALALQRRKLSEADADGRTAIADAISDIAARPSNFFDDTVIYLGLRVAWNRLLLDGSEETVASVQKLLWDLALRLEDGDFALAERDLMDAQRRLDEAMRDGADSEEVQRLMNELRQALDEYIEALAEQLQRQNLTDIPAMTPDMQMLQSQDLQQLMDDAQEMARAGAMDAAQELMNQLRQALDAIRQGMAMAPQQQQQMQESQRLMRGLQELTARQSQLLDQTFQDLQDQRSGSQRRNQGNQQQGALPFQQQGEQGQQGQQGQQGDQSQQGQQGNQGQQGQQGQQGRQGQQPGQGSLADQAARQNALRRALGDLILQMDEMLGNFPPSLNDAEKAMRGARDALSRGDAGSAVPFQTEALEHLQQGAQQAQEQMAQQFGQGMSLRQRPGQGQQPGQRNGQDPFGRSEGGAFGAVEDGQTKVPTRLEMRRAREILLELRKRSGEQSRPPVEREYIDRLLDQF